jgi:hypothetical protein
MSGHKGINTCIRLAGLLCGLLVLPVLSGHATAQEQVKTPPTIAEKTAGMQHYAGYFDFFWDEQSGKIFLEIDAWDSEFLYVNALSAGIGSNDIGLDRGQLGNIRVVKFQRVGPKVLLVQPNYDYRAVSDNIEEQRSVEEAFAQSTLWGFTVAAEENGRVLVDMEKFLLRDAHDVAGTLQQTKQGGYKVDASRSAMYLPQTKNFPQNTEWDVTLTFVGEPDHRWIRSVTPTPQAVTVRQHHSFVQLPDDDYQPRRYDPRAGFFDISYMDYAVPIGSPIQQRLIVRHRLKKQNPRAKVSTPVEPIVYYLDRGTPEPVRSALLEGASWWNEAFEAAGYRDAFRVEMLPEGVDPLDVRYNVIQWVHRSTRGWSYGMSVHDPRTGELIKGHVSLGSLRVRQDYLIAEGLLAPYEEGRSVPPEMLELALARLRQLSAHEVGHTLGLAHNFAASTNSRSSVMDYPHPMVSLKNDGTMDLSNAYDTRIGEWDKVSIRYGYSEIVDNADVQETLNRIIDDAISQGQEFISDSDARAQGGAHPRAHLWDNGADPADELLRILRVRAGALSRFSERNIQPGAPMALLEEALAPMYMMHRYQVEAAVKVIGGLDYSYSLRGDGQTVTKPLSPEFQRRALDAVLQTLSPENLLLPESILRLIPPRPMGYPRSAENFGSRTGVTFDPLSAVESAVNLTLRLLLHPERAARLLEYHARDANAPALTEMLDQVMDAIWQTEPLTGYQNEIQHVVSTLTLQHLIQLAGNTNTRQQVRAIVLAKLDGLGDELRRKISYTSDAGQLAHYTLAEKQITQFLEKPDAFQFTSPQPPPAGSPIGGGHRHGLVRCDW